MTTISVLTSRQAQELHKSMIAYLTANGMPESAASLRNEANLPISAFDESTCEKYGPFLEKKWTSVAKQSKRIMDLEAKNAQLQQELETATPLTSRTNVDPASWLPRAPARHTLSGHRLDVTSVAFHPVFSELASSSEDCTIRIWDFEQGERLHTLKGHTRAVLDVDYGGPRGGTLLASCSSDLTIKLWDPSDDYKNIRTLPGHDHSISSVRFIPSGAAGAPLSGNLLVSASRDKTLKVWDVTTGYCLKTLRGHAEWVRCVAPTIDGRHLLSAGQDRTARLWDVSTGEQKIVFEGHDHYLEAVAIAPSSAYQYLATICGYKKPPLSSSQGEFVATAGRDKLIKIWDNRGTCHKTLTGHDNWIRGLVFHPGGKYLLSASEDKTIKCWDLSQEGKCVKTVEGHGHFVTGIRWAPDTQTSATNGAPGGINGANGTTIVNKKDDSGGGGKIRCILATSSVDMEVRIFAG